MWFSFNDTVYFTKKLPSSGWEHRNDEKTGSSCGDIAIHPQETLARNFSSPKRRGFAEILCVFQKVATNLGRKRAARGRRGMDGKVSTYTNVGARDYSRAPALFTYIRCCRCCHHQWVRRTRPLARRRARTLRPLAVAMRLRKPWTLER